MAFFPQYPIYAYHPVPYANQDFYGMYPPGSEGAAFYEGGSPPHHQPHHFGRHGPPPAAGSSGYKHGFANRKDSADSGISDFSAASRKTSNTSTISNASLILEESQLEDVKEEPPFEEPDDELCEKIVQQVR